MAREKERVDIDFGKILRERRRQLNLTMLEVAKFCGVSEGTISRWETGIVESIKVSHVSKLSEILDITIETIVGYSDLTAEVPAPVILKRQEVLRLVKKCSEVQLDDIIRFVKIFILAK